MPALKGLLFDKDGTLLDFHATWTPVYTELVQRLAAGDPALAVSLLESGGHDAATGRVRGGTVLAQGNTLELAEAWLPHLPHWEAEKLVALLDEVFSVQGVAASCAVLDLAAFFNRLKARGFRIGVATSDNEAAAKAILERFEALHLLDFVAGYDSGHGVKPTPGMVRGFCRETGLEAAEVAVIGDNRHDMDMGRSAGAGAVIGVLTGTSTREDLGSHADVVLESIAELEGWLDRAAAA